MPTDSPTDKPIMKCGHAANAELTDGTPVCVICYGIGGLGGGEVAATQPDLTGRTAFCSQCGGHERDSDPRLPFFSHTPNLPYDRYYCGCRGWE